MLTMPDEKKKSEDQQMLDKIAKSEYKYGFTTDIERDPAPRGLNEDTIRFISAKKNEPEFMLEWRLKAYRRWSKMTEPKWAFVEYPPINYQDAIYYAAPKSRPTLKRMTELDLKLLKL